MVDLGWLNKTTVVKNFKPDSSSKAYTAIRYQGGARWGDVNKGKQVGF